MLTAAIAFVCMAAAFHRAAARRSGEARAVRAALEALSAHDGVTAPWRRRGNGWARMTTMERLRSDLGKIARAMPPGDEPHETRIDRLLRCRRRGWIQLYHYRADGPPLRGEVRALLTDEGRQALLLLRERVGLPAPTARLLT